MQYLLIILSLFSLSFSQLLPSDEDISNMWDDEKLILYRIEKKFPTGAILREMFIPTLGYAYINDWKRGLYFGATKSALLYLTYDQLYKAQDFIEYYNWNGSWSEYSNKKQQHEKEHYGNALMLTASLLAINIYQIFDLYTQTEKYNRKLHNKIFGKKNANLSFLILPSTDGAYLNLTYKF